MSRFNHFVGDIPSPSEYPIGHVFVLDNDDLETTVTCTRTDTGWRVVPTRIMGIQCSGWPGADLGKPGEVS